jgi:uncharacterized membrane protein HdeD (DUF308 family)
MNQKAIGFMTIITGIMLVYFAFNMDETGPAFVSSFLGGWALSNGVRRIVRAIQADKQQPKADT